MQVQFNKIDPINATMHIAIQKSDYQEAVEKELKKHQKQVAVKGFRVGFAPIGMIKSLYGKGIIADQVTKLATNALYDYLKENNIDIIAQPMDSNTIPTKFDVENDEDFEFGFDLGLAPEFELNIEGKSMDRYVIQVDDKEIDSEIKNLTVRYGEVENMDTNEANDLVYAEATELNDDNSPLQDGIKEAKISFTAEMVKEEELKSKLIGLKKDQEIDLNIFTLFNNNESVISNSLNVPKEELDNIKPNFRIKITEITRRKPAEINQQLFDKILGENVVSTEAEFREKIKEKLEGYFINESNHHVEHMISHVLSDNHQFDLPNDFLKRWLLERNKETYNQENIDERYTQESKTLKDILIREKIAAKYEIKVDMKDIEQASLGYTLSMFRNYGLQNPDFEFVKKFSDDSLKKKEYVEQMNDIALRQKVYAQVKELLSFNDISVTVDQFYEELQKHNHTH